MCNLFYIPVKVISKQAATWFLISPSFNIFSIRYTQSADQPAPVPKVDHPHHIIDPTIYYVKGYNSVNKQYIIDYFLD